MGYPSSLFRWSGEYHDCMERCRSNRIRQMQIHQQNERVSKMAKIVMWFWKRDNLIELLKHKKADHLIELVSAWADLMTVGEEINLAVLMGLCVYGEARGESVLGQIAVTEIVHNRFQRGKYDTIEDVLLQPLQFSCFNRGNKSLDGAIDCDYQTVLKYCSQAATVIECIESRNSRVLPADTTIYLTEVAWKRVALRWAQGKTDAWDVTKLRPRGQIDRHLFFAEK